MRSVFIHVLLPLLLLAPSGLVRAENSVTQLEQDMSATLDLWRDGRYEQLFEHLAHRGRTSKEAFVKKMRETTVRPACCFQKMEGFKVLSEKRSQATIYAKIGLEGSPGAVDNSCTREFKLTYEEGVWKMQLSDIYALAGTKAKRKSSHHHTRSSW